MIKSRRMRWARTYIRNVEKRNAYRIRRKETTKGPKMYAEE
jgi:hypothetical protein